MKKGFILSGLLALSIIGCSTPMINTGQGFTDFEKEYKSFSTKALSDAYVKRMFGKYLAPVNSVQLTRQLEFSRYLKSQSDTTYEASLKSIFEQTPVLYDQMTAIGTISDKMTSESGTFGTYVIGLSPYASIPVATNASNITSTSFIANWNTSNRATSYKLFVNENELYSGTATSFNVTGLSAGTTNNYYVKAINNAGTSGSSNTVSVNLTSATPDTPLATSATNITQTSFTANWNSVPGVGNYDVFIDGVNVMRVFNQNSGNISYTHTGLVPGSTHTYYIRALNSGVFSSNSNTISVTLMPMTQLTEVQSIATKGAFNWESFSINGDDYLALASYASGTSVSKDYSIDSVIYKRDTSTNQFEQIQLIPTNGASDWEYFTINGEHYIAVANYYSGSAYNINSVIYKWNPTSNIFEVHQSIPSTGAHGWESFTINGEHYIALANFSNGSTYNLNSKIFKWNEFTNQFDTTPIQTIATNGAINWKSFTIGTENYLAISNCLSGTIASPDYSISSRIYKWNTSTNQFDQIQVISTNGAYDWEFFTIGTESYIVVANFYNGSTYNINSNIYRWNTSTNQFDITPVQSIATKGARDWEYFNIGSEHYLAIANYKTGTDYTLDSKIYKWNGTLFTEFSTIPTSAASSWKYLQMNDYHYLALSNSYNGSTYNINSKIYRLD